MPAPIKKTKKRTGTSHSFEDMSVRSSLAAEVHRASADLRTLLGTPWDSNISQQPLRHQHFHSGMMMNHPQHQTPQLPDTSCLYPSPQNLQPLPQNLQPLPQNLQPLPPSAPILPHLNRPLSTLPISSYATQTPLYNDCAFVRPNGFAVAEYHHRRRFYPHQAPAHNTPFPGHLPWLPAEAAREQQTETLQSECQRSRPKRKSRENKEKQEITEKQEKYLQEDNNTSTTLTVEENRVEGSKVQTKEKPEPGISFWEYLNKIFQEDNFLKKLELKQTTETSPPPIWSDLDPKPSDFLPLMDPREELFDITKIEELQEQEFNDTHIEVKNGCELEDVSENEASTLDPCIKRETEINPDNIMEEIAIQKICQAALERMEIMFAPEKSAPHIQEVNECLGEDSDLSLNVVSCIDQNEVDKGLTSDKHSRNTLSRINSPVCTTEPKTPSTSTEEPTLGDNCQPENVIKSQVKQNTENVCCDQSDNDSETSPTKSKDNEARKCEPALNEKSVNKLKEDHHHSSDLDHDDLGSPNMMRDQDMSAEVTVNQSVKEVDISESHINKNESELKSTKDLAEEDKESEDEEETAETSLPNIRTRPKVDKTPSSSILTEGETVRGKRKANKNPEDEIETECTRGKQSGLPHRKQLKEAARDNQPHGHEHKNKVAKTQRGRKRNGQTTH